MTLLATLTPTGFGPGLQLPGALDRDAFDTFVTHALAPTLRPGDVVVLDNLAVHKSAAAQRAIDAAGATLRILCGSCPRIRRTEQAFAHLKGHLRAVHVGSVATAKAATREAYPRVTATHVRGYSRHAAYTL